jgi:FixJ family two-component response regulator
VALFRSARLDALEFSSAEALLAALPIQDLACIVTDLRMPCMGGLELMAELLRRDIRVPLILVSAHLMPQVIVLAASIGVASVMEKPIDPEQLLERVFELLSSDLN